MRPTPPSKSAALGVDQVRLSSLRSSPCGCICREPGSHKIMCRCAGFPVPPTCHAYQPRPPWCRRAPDRTLWQPPCKCKPPKLLHHHPAQAFFSVSSPPPTRAPAHLQKSPVAARYGANRTIVSPIAESSDAHRHPSQISASRSHARLQYRTKTRCDHLSIAHRRELRYFSEPHGHPRRFLRASMQSRDVPKPSFLGPDFLGCL